MPARLPGLSPPKTPGSSKGGPSVVRLPACRGADIRVETRSGDRKKSILVTGTPSSAGGSVTPARSVFVPKQSKSPSPVKPVTPILAKAQSPPKKPMMSFLEETASMFSRLEAERQAGEKGTATALNRMLDDTHNARKVLQQGLEQLQREAEQLAREYAVVAESCNHGQELYEASMEIDRMRSTYPERFKGELSVDRVSPAVTVQAEDVTISRRVMGEQKKIMEDAQARNQQLQDSVRGDMDTKMQGWNVDKGALSLKSPPANLRNSKSQAQLDQDKWIHNINELLRQVSSGIHETKAQREVAGRLRKQRAEAVKQAAYALVEVMLDKQQRRRMQLNFLDSNRQRLVRHDEKLQKTFAEFAVKEGNLQGSLMQAEARLGARNARPSQECKSDDAELSLMAEITTLQEMLAELHMQKQRMEKELQKSKQELQEADMQYKDAEAARDIDAACMKLECEKSFMHKHHKWLVAMVNYEFNMNLLPHENEFKRITCNR